MEQGVARNVLGEGSVCIGLWPEADTKSALPDERLRCGSFWFVSTTPIEDIELSIWNMKAKKAGGKHLCLVLTSCLN